MKDFYKFISIFSVIFLCLPGCGDDRENPDPARTKAVELAVEFDLAPDASSDNGVLDDYFIEGRSIILISQRGQHLNINFDDYTTDSDGQEIVNENLYKYVYYSNSGADWKNNYNFQPYGNHALDWLLMKQNEMNDGYGLGALYYPVQYNVLNSVEPDQSSYENILRSNVLGAWHKTSTYQDRLTFRFNHLMSAFKVTILIPDWNPEDNTGFGADAAKRAYMLKVKKDFVIEWPTNLSTEEAPVPRIIEDSEVVDIRMYLESVANDAVQMNLHDISSDFPDKTDSYRTATFVVIFPPQQPASDGPAMRFILSTMGEMEKSFVWKTNNILGSSLQTGRGTVNHFILYLPRTENNALLVQSYVVPWTEAESSFTVIPDDI